MNHLMFILGVFLNKQEYMAIYQNHFSHEKYRPDIDGLRAIAVLAVVSFHTFPNLMKGGFIGVDVFFVISGYLISTIILEDLDKNAFNFLNFYARRIRRIFPTLILVLISCFAFGWFVLLPSEFEQLGKHIASSATFVSNLILWKESGYFDTPSDIKPLLHLWSLGIEEQFYIVWPLLLWITYKKRFNLLSIGLLVALISFYLNIYKVKTDIVAAFYLPQTRFWELMIGSLLAWGTLYNPVFSTKPIFHDERENDSKTLVSIISVFALLLLIFGFCYIDKNIGFPGKWALIPVFSTFLLIYVGSKAWVNSIILSNKVVVWFGLISFPLYLWHWPLLSFARILEDEVPTCNIRIAAILLSITLAWLTYQLVERPIRVGKHSTLKTISLVILMTIVGYVGYNDFERNGLPFRLKKITYEKMPFKRKNFAQALVYFNWYRGKGDWLFLGDIHDKTVSKLKLLIIPTQSEIEATQEVFSTLAKTAAQFKTKVVLIIGPNKSNIYPEYLPENLVPSTKKYSSFFLEKLKDIPNLIVYNPMDDFLRLKKSEGILYWMTDTHWNNKGAFLAYSGFSTLLGLPIPEVEFQHNSTHSGDLISISKLENFPLHPEDNWDVIWKNKPVWTEKEIPDEQKTMFGATTIVHNKNSLLNKSIWVVGDSFSKALRQYFNATFKEVYYIGHWANKLKHLPVDLAHTEKKPDMIVVVRVERSF